MKDPCLSVFLSVPRLLNRAQTKRQRPPVSSIYIPNHGQSSTDCRRHIKVFQRKKTCALAVVRQSKKNSPRRRPPSRGARDGQNLIRGSMHAISSYRGNRPTNKHTHTHTHTHTHIHRQDRLQYIAPQCNNNHSRRIYSASWTVQCIDRHWTSFVSEY